MINLRNIVFFLFAMVISVNYVFAENYIMLSNTPIKSVECVNSGIISVKPLASLFNEKKTIIISPLCDGTAEFKVKLDNRTLSYKVVVKDKKIDFSGNRVIKIVPLDLPPEVLPEGDDSK